MQKNTTYTKQVKQQTITIDAKDKILGRLATQITTELRGKNQPNFAFHQVLGNKIIVKNAKYIAVSGRKATDKKYFRHTGYLGHIKEESLKNLLERRPEQVLRKAVYGMLPKNRLRKEFLNNLTIYAEDITADKKQGDK